MFSSIRRVLPLGSLLLLLPLAGCGGGSTGPSVPTATATPSPTSAPLPALSSPQLLIDGHQIGATYWATGDTSSGGAGQSVDNLGCGPMDETYHVHSHLSIFLNGKALAIPAAIGITNPTFQTDSTFPDGFAIYGDCHYSLHTHDTSGKLHIEAPRPITVTLGQVFQIWGQPLSYDNIAGITGLPVVVYVNDGTNLRRYTGDLSALPLAPDREITIQIGSAVSQIPTYDWANSLKKRPSTHA